MTSWVHYTPNMRKRVTSVKSRNCAPGKRCPPSVLGVSVVTCTLSKKVQIAPSTQGFSQKAVVVETKAARAATLPALLVTSKSSNLFPKG